MRRRSARTAMLLLIGVILCPLGALAQDNPVAKTRRTDTLFGSTVPLPEALHGKIYHLPEDTKKLPDFESLKSVGDLYTYTLQIKPQVYTGEYRSPMGKEDWFGIQYFARFWIKQPGVFQFFLCSDDGARLYIDDLVILDNDGIHQARTKASQVTLPRGMHRIRIDYFQGPPTGVALQLAIRPPGESIQVFDTRNFSPPATLTEPSLQPRPK